MPSGDPSDDASRRNRRSILKRAGIGLAVTLGLGAGEAAADAGTQAGWEYQCIPFECPDGGGNTLQRRYCCNGSCSCWETYGCC